LTSLTRPYWIAIYLMRWGCLTRRRRLT
jgi:hypothetical protein